MSLACLAFQLMAKQQRQWITCRRRFIRLPRSVISSATFSQPILGTCLFIHGKGREPFDTSCNKLMGPGAIMDAVSLSRCSVEKKRLKPWKKKGRKKQSGLVVYSKCQMTGIDPCQSDGTLSYPAVCAGADEPSWAWLCLRPTLHLSSPPWCTHCPCFSPSCFSFCCCVFFCFFVLLPSWLLRPCKNPLRTRPDKKTGTTQLIIDRVGALRVSLISWRSNEVNSSTRSPF